MNRGHWKQFSSWKPEEKFIEREKKVAAEVQVTKGYTWTEEMGIAIACLIEDEKTHLINWVKEVKRLDFHNFGSPPHLFLQILAGVISQRRGLIEETDKVDSDDENEDDEGSESEAKPASWRNPSGEAIAKFTDFCTSIPHEFDEIGTNMRTAIPYTDELQADAATHDPHLKLMFRLLKFEVQEEQDSESERVMVVDIA